MDKLTANKFPSEAQYCEMAYESQDMTYEWMMGMEALNNTKRTSLGPQSNAGHKIFSRFVYDVTCPRMGRSTEYVWIEPLAATLRHPTALCPHFKHQALRWTPGTLIKMTEGWWDKLLDREYLLLASSEEPTFNKDAQKVGH